jgi:putative NIF3 family GTP cyclohydrolase 1 type 2
MSLFFASLFLKRQFSTVIRNHSGMDLKEVVKRLEHVAPTSLAGSWDNVGLLIQPSGDKLVNKLILTNDLTEPVMDECLSANVDMIVSYHPPIFQGLKRLTTKSWKVNTIKLLTL